MLLAMSILLVLIWYCSEKICAAINKNTAAITADMASQDRLMSLLAEDHRRQDERSEAAQSEVHRPSEPFPYNILGDQRKGFNPEDPFGLSQGTEAWPDKAPEPDPPREIEP